MEQINETVIVVENKRPTFLTVLCILSFVAAGISIVGLLLATLFAGVASTANSMPIEGLTAEQQAATGAVLGNMWAYLGAALVMILLSLFGVIKMWKLQKSGFYMYVAAAVIGIIVDVTLGLGFSAFGAVISVAFVVMYGLNLKHMR